MEEVFLQPLEHLAPLLDSRGRREDGGQSMRLSTHLAELIRFTTGEVKWCPTRLPSAMSADSLHVSGHHPYTMTLRTPVSEALSALPRGTSLSDICVRDTYSLLALGRRLPPSWTAGITGSGQMNIRRVMSLLKGQAGTSQDVGSGTGNNSGDAGGTKWGSAASRPGGPGG